MACDRWCSAGAGARELRDAVKRSNGCSSTSSMRSRVRSSPELGVKSTEREGRARHRQRGRVRHAHRCDQLRAVGGRRRRRRRLPRADVVLVACRVQPRRRPASTWRWYGVFAANYPLRPTTTSRVGSRRRWSVRTRKAVQAHGRPASAGPHPQRAPAGERLIRDGTVRGTWCAAPSRFPALYMALVPEHHRMLDRGDCEPDHRPHGHRATTVHDAARGCGVASRIAKNLCLFRPCFHGRA